MTDEHWKPSVTCDTVVMQKQHGEWMVLLIERAHPPFAGTWALPGGFLDEHEDLEACARRELMEETGVQVGRLEQLAAYGRPGRDPRGRTVTIAFLANAGADTRDPRGGDDARRAEWHPALRPPPLAFDHAQILADALARLRASGLLAS